MDQQRIVETFRSACGACGFDLVMPVQVGTYNCRVEGALRLEDFGSPLHLAIVVGNSRALWPRFLAALRADAALLADPDPLDRYTERCIATAVEASGLEVSVRFAHDVGVRSVAMQRLAEVAGLAYLSESHLSVHPQFGPWIGLRAALSLPVLGPAPRAPLVHPCGGCAGRCLPAFERAREAMQGLLTEEAARDQWKRFLACRDACPTGRDYRYGDGQIRYHYLKDRQQLSDDCWQETAPV